jgi:6-phosphogluconate dehydrogenase (decarboxylating)
MRKRIMTSACLVLLMGGAAYAVDDKAKEQAQDQATDKAKEQKCIEQLIRAEKLVYDKVKAKTLSEAQAEEINVLLDEADALCTEGNYGRASKTLRTVNKKATKAKQ